MRIHSTNASIWYFSLDLFYKPYEDELEINQQEQSSIERECDIFKLDLPHTHIDDCKPEN